MTKAPGRRRILQLIVDHPGISMPELTVLRAGSAAVVQQHVIRLLRNGLVEAAGMKQSPFSTFQVQTYAATAQAASFLVQGDAPSARTQERVQETIEHALRGLGNDNTGARLFAKSVWFRWPAVYDRIYTAAVAARQAKLAADWHRRRRDIDERSIPV